MIIEGIPTFCLGIFTYFWLPNDAATAHFLNEDERRLQVVRMSRGYGATVAAQSFTWKDAIKAPKDWKVWLFCLGQFGADTVLYGEFVSVPKVAANKRCDKMADRGQDIRLFFPPLSTAWATGLRPRSSCSRSRATSSGRCFT